MAGGAMKAIQERRVIEHVMLAVGFGCMIGYVRLVSLGFVGYLEQGVIEPSDSWYLLRACVMLAALAVLAIASLFKWAKDNVLTVLVSTACAVAAALLFAIDDAKTLGPAIAVLEGAASAALMYTWMLLLSGQPVNVIVGVCLAGGGFAGMVIACVPFLDESLALVVAVFAAFVAGSVLLLANRGSDFLRPDGVPSRNELMRVPWVTIVMVLACGFLGTAVYGIAVRMAWLHDWSPNYIAFSLAAVVTVVMTLAIMLRSRAWMHKVWIPITLLLAIALGFACVSVRESMQIALGLVLASVFCGRYLYWMILPAVFSTLRTPHAFLAAAFLFFANGSLAVLAGDALGGILPRSMQNLGGVAGIVTLALVVLLAVTFIAYRRAFGAMGYWSERIVVAGDSRASRQAVHDGPTIGLGGVPVQVYELDSVGEGNAERDGASDSAEETHGDAFKDTLPERVQGSAAEYGLTARETEVAILTAQGFSCAYIAEKLVVSNSTVRFHQQNIYRKFDVHSRNELIEFFLDDKPSD